MVTNALRGFVVLLTLIVLPASAGGPVRPCVDVSECPAGWTCEYPVGDCARANGNCEPTPMCDLASGPVCGCDAFTYPDECAAEAAGTVVEALGFCAVGNPCSFDDMSACFPGQVCEYPLGDCEQLNGTCVDQTTCDPNSGLVCGCDFIAGGTTGTYTSECAAEANDITVMHLGACQIGASCGGQTCTGNEFCQLPAGTCNQGMPESCQLGQFLGVTQARQYEISGVCTPVPQACPPVEDQVCDCEGHTYLNACEATRAFTSVLREGACDNGICGGLFGIPCGDPDDLCVHSCFGCGIPDLPGRCEPEAASCPSYCAPVCACSDTWYPNRCEWLLAEAFPGGGPFTTTNPAGCGEVWGAVFLTKTELAWAFLDQDDSYSIYRAVLGAGGQPASWGCFTSGVTEGKLDVFAAPAPGEVWAFTVASVRGGSEGPIGWGGTGCTERVVANPCPP